MGVHRTVSPSDEELEKLGKELLEWAQDDSGEGEHKHCFFSQFYSVKKRILRKDWKAIVQIPVFLPYYEAAQSLLANRQVNGHLKEGIAQRFMRCYHHDVRESDDEVIVLKGQVARKQKDEDENEQQKNLRACFNELTRELKGNSSGLSTDIRPELAAGEPILDQGCLREPSEVQTELGTTGNNPEPS